MQKDEQEFLYELGKKIEVEYRKKFPSQNAFAKAVECDERTIRRIIRGEQNVSLLLLRSISKELEISLSELFMIKHHQPKKK